MGCGTGGCGVAAFGGAGGRGSYGGVMHVMARELAEARGEGTYLDEAAKGIRAELDERGLVPVGDAGATPEGPDRGHVMFVVILFLFLAAMGALAAAHVAGWDAAPVGTSADDE